MGKMSVVVVGAGNTGAFAVPLVARMPEVGGMTLCDRDVYESRNAVNQNIALQDVGQPKVSVLARKLKEIRPDLKVTAFYAPLESLPLGAWRADLIAACVDSRAARQVVNERAWRLGIPWVDCGVLGSESLARVNVYQPAEDAPCLECPWSTEEYAALLAQQYPCGGPANAPAPNTASAELGALAAALLAVECRKMLTGDLGCAVLGRQATVNARWHRLDVTSFRRNPRCRFDHATWRISPLRCNMREVRVADLLGMARAIRVPGQRFVRRLVCVACGGGKKLFHLAASLDRAQRFCERCGEPMTSTGFDIVERLDGDLPEGESGQTLEQVGLRYGEVILAGDSYYEVTREI